MIVCWSNVTSAYYVLDDATDFKKKAVYTHAYIYTQRKSGHIGRSNTITVTATSPIRYDRGAREPLQPPARRKLNESKAICNVHTPERSNPARRNVDLCKSTEMAPKKACTGPGSFLTFHYITNPRTTI